MMTTPEDGPRSALRSRGGTAWWILGVLVAIAVFTRLWATMDGRQVLVRGGRLHVHEGDRCRTYAIPLLCSCNIPIFLCTRTHCGSQFTACRSNLKNLGTALEMYSTDHRRFPERLADLTPEYLKHVPTCPHDGIDTYSQGYTSAPRAYTIVCSGWRHDDVGQGPNYPQYTSEQGVR